MPSLFRPLLTAAALMLPGAAVTQTAPQPPQAPPQDAPITVTGDREAQRQVADFVAALTAASPQGLLSRFENWHVCPAAAGLAPEQRTAVADRLRRVAAAAGIEVGGASCIPNVLVLVADDKKAMIREFGRRYPGYMGEMSRAERRRLVESPGPAAAWHVKGAPINADGMEVAYDGEGQAYMNRTARALSRITVAARPQFAAAVVVVERRALEGLTVTQLADYAAMRTLIRTDPRALAASPIPSILKVLEAPMGSALPLTLTRWDFGVLCGLYAARANVYAASQRSEIRRGIERKGVAAACGSESSARAGAAPNGRSPL